MTDFQSKSPSELREFAKENEIDLAGVDSRRKAELVKALEAWQAGATYVTSFEQDPDTPTDDTDTPQNDADEPEDTGEQFFESDEKTDDVAASFDAGEKGVTAAPVSSEPAPVATKTLEQLEVADLVGDDNRVRVILNTFPTVVDGKDLCRLMIVEVPGEQDTTAVVWWRNSASGPVQQAPISRVASRSTDPETRENIITTISGDEVRYYRSSSCPTCGNRLSNWRPWRQPVRMVQVSRR